MATIEKSIVVDAPLKAVYNQWTQFEEFPRFMEGIEHVKQLSDKKLHWKAKIAGKTEEWDAQITEQTPDRQIAWRSTSGSQNDGVVTFRSEGANKTHITLRLDYDPEGVVENVGDKLGFVSRRVEGDLKRFSEFIEERGRETGGWRGEIHSGQVEKGGSTGTMGATGTMGTTGTTGTTGTKTNR
jgi:uncharacterized membrane protein